MRSVLVIPRPFAAALIVALSSAPAVAGELSDDVQASMPLLLKVLTYDVNFDARGLGDFTVLVIGDPTAPEKREATFKALKDLPAQKVKTRPLKFATTEFKDESALQAEIDKTRASALLVVTGVPMPVVKHVWEVAQDNQTYVLAFDTAMIEFGLPVGVQTGAGKPQILINEKGAKSVGAKFETTILKLARVIQ